MKKVNCFLLLFLWILPYQINANQQEKVRGLVTDAIDGTPVKGVKVSIENTPVLTYSDVNGNFEFESIEEGQILKIEAPGYIPQRLPQEQGYYTEISLQPDYAGLYITDEDSKPAENKLTSVKSAGIIGSTSLKSQLLLDPSTSLQGKIPGIQVTGIGGVPGTYTDLRIRGINTIMSGTEPLIVVDGHPIDPYAYSAAGFRMGSVGEINLEDISSIKVLKDAAATAIYGSRASNGVILLETKKGKSGKKGFSLSLQKGISVRPTNTLEVLTANEYRDVASKAWNNSFPNSAENPPVNLNGYMGFYAYDYTDPETNETFPATIYQNEWLNDIIEKGDLLKLSASFAGGDENTHFYAGGTYRKEKTWFLGAEFNMASFLLNLDQQHSENLSYGLKVSASTINRDFNHRDWFRMAQTVSLPIYPLKAPENDKLYWYNYQNEVNIKALNEYSYNKSDVLRTLDQAWAEYTFFKGLALRSEWSIDYQYTHNEDYRHPYVFPSGVGTRSGNGRVLQSRYDVNNWMTNNYIEFDRIFDQQHKLNIKAGGSAQSVTNGGANAHVEDLGLSFVHTNGQSNVQELVWVDYTSYKYASWYGTLYYSYNDKYILDASYRADASSRFGKNNQWGYFPGFGAGWIFSEENFLNNVELIDLAKIRVSYGKTGNSFFGNMSSMSVNPEGYYNNDDILSDGWLNYGNLQGLVPVRMANPDLKWETTTQMNAGLDLSLLKNRIYISADYFSKSTEDLLMFVPSNPLSGFQDINYLSNGGSIETSGIELYLSVVPVHLSNSFKWMVNGSVATINTELTALPEDMDHIDGAYNRLATGNPYGTWFLPEWGGVDPETGHEYIIDPETGENMDAEIMTDEEFRSYSRLIADKTPFPDMYGGFGTNLSFKGLSIDVFFSYQFGNYVLDLGELSKAYIGSGSTSSKDLLEGWTPDNPTDVPLLWESVMQNRATDRFLYDASYIRLRNLRVGYDLPRNMTDYLRSSSITLYVTGQNLITISDYPGWDPEALPGMYQSMNNLNAGVISFELPQTSYFVFGIDVTF